MKKTMDANQIKLLAILAMTIDHIAWLVFPGYSKAPLALLMHLIGRMTCPIMCFFIAEGYYHTRDLNRYTLRLFVFAVISHFAYIFASQDFVDARSFIPFYYGGILNQTSVMWSLAWGLVMLRVANHPGYSQLKKTLLVVLICLVSFPSDWSCIASLCVMAFGTNVVYGLLQMAVALSLPVLARYNGLRGKDPRINRVMKWLFYLYYPLHLAILGTIQYLR